MLLRDWNLKKTPYFASYNALCESLTTNSLQNELKTKASRVYPRRRLTNGITATMGASSSEEPSPALMRTGKTLGTGEENSWALQDAGLGDSPPNMAGEECGPADTGATAGFWHTGRGCSEVAGAATATGIVDSTHSVNGGSPRHEKSSNEHGTLAHCKHI